MAKGFHLAYSLYIAYPIAAAPSTIAAAVVISRCSLRSMVIGTAARETSCVSEMHGARRPLLEGLSFSNVQRYSPIILRLIEYCKETCVYTEHSLVRLLQVLVKCRGSKAAHSRQHATHAFRRCSIYRIPGPTYHPADDTTQTFRNDMNDVIVGVPASLKCYED